MGARGSLQTYPPQDRPLATLKGLRPFVFYKASHESALTPFWGPPQGAWTRHKAAQGQRRQLGLAPGTDKGSGGKVTGCRALARARARARARGRGQGAGGRGQGAGARGAFLPQLSGRGSGT